MCNISGSVSLESHYDIYSQTPVQLKLGRSLTEWKQLNDVILCLTNSLSGIKTLMNDHLSRHLLYEKQLWSSSGEQS